MKMVKSLLLGTAAGLVAMTGAQAADLPVKAKPVQYVKICSLYGAGFYYIPGTDMCLKIGGWVRAEYSYGYNGSMTAGPYNGNNVNNRTTNDMGWRSRGYITADARNQSEYGTIRSYIAVGLSTNDVGADTGSNHVQRQPRLHPVRRASRSVSPSRSMTSTAAPATAYMGNYPQSDTGDGGWMVVAYTAQFGGGLSATLSAEMSRRTTVPTGTGAAARRLLSPAVAPRHTVARQRGRLQMPDVVANLRIDQAWGSAQIMGAVHQVNATYYEQCRAPPSN